PNLPLFYKSSKGFLMFFRLFSLTWVYIMVVLGLLCPKRDCMYLMSVPLSSKWVAKLCLRLCRVMPCLKMPAFRIAFFNTCCALLEVYGPPSCPSKRYVFGL